MGAESAASNGLPISTPNGSERKGHDGDDLHNFTKSVEATHQIPQLDLLVGGFPCQDYSVARTVSGELGIQGEKGKLWTPIWQSFDEVMQRQDRETQSGITRERPSITEFTS